jgi:hypothetical protein
MEGLWHPRGTGRLEGNASDEEPNEWARALCGCFAFDVELALMIPGSLILC